MALKHMSIQSKNERKHAGRCKGTERGRGGGAAVRWKIRDELYVNSLFAVLDAPKLNIQTKTFAGYLIGYMQQE